MNNIVIFDLDGTLVDSGDNIVKAVNHTRRTLGLVDVDSDYVLDNINKDDINAAQVFYGTTSFLPEQREIFEPFYNEICHQNIALYEGISYFLEQFSSLGYKMGVATNGKTYFANKMLKQLGVEHYFDIVVGSDSVAVSKPDPAMLLKILDFVDFSQESRAIMVGDSIKDVKAAKAIGIPSAVAEWGFGSQKPCGDKNLSHTGELEWIIDFFKD